jgi:hypothetical protein
LVIVFYLDPAVSEEEAGMYESGIIQRTPRAFEYEIENVRNEILTQVLLEELRLIGWSPSSKDPAQGHPSRDTVLRLISWFQGVNHGENIPRC